MFSGLPKTIASVNPLGAVEIDAETLLGMQKRNSNCKRQSIEAYERLDDQPRCRRASISVKVTDSPCRNSECLSIAAESLHEDLDSLEYSSLSSSTTPQKRTEPHYYIFCGVRLFSRAFYGLDHQLFRTENGEGNAISRPWSWTGYSTINKNGTTDSNHSSSLIPSQVSHTGKYATNSSPPVSGNIEMVEVLLDSSAQSRNNSRHQSQYIEFEDSTSLHTWGSKDSNASEDDSVNIPSKCNKPSTVLFCF